MSNNSWKQYGGISKMDNFNTINASTIIADQFVSRSVRPQYQLLNGTFEVTEDIISGNSSYSNVDVFSNRDIYTNNKLFFGNNTFVKNGDNLPTLTDVQKNTHAYLYGNDTNIGINTIIPKTCFNITGSVGSITDILTVESKNVLVRNIIAQNINQRGIVVNADDASSNILFYNDVSTNSINIPDAMIKYQDGGLLTTQTTEHILSTAKIIQHDSSGGTLLMNTNGTALNSSGYLDVDISGEIDFYTNTGFKFDCLNTTTFTMNDISTNIITNGDIKLFTDNNNIVFDTSGGVIVFESGDINLNTLLKFSPPERGVSNELLHNETVTIYDNNNTTFLPNVYNDPTILTGNSTTFIGKDPSANTFIFMNPAIRKDGGAIGGGMAPHDSSRAMTVIGTTDPSGNYIPSQMTISGANKHKYISTVGINTHKPRTEDYVLDVNGPMHLGNGEINTIADNTYEITSMSFSKKSSYLDYGIAVGSPSTKTGSGVTQTENALLSSANTLTDPIDEGTYSKLQTISTRPSTGTTGGTGAELTIVALENEITSITVTDSGNDYAAGDILTVTDAVLANTGRETPLIFTLTADHIVDVAEYNQILLYTNDGGEKWNKSDIFEKGGLNTDNPVSMRYIDVFDNLYSAIAGENGNLFISNDSGQSWYKLQLDKVDILTTDYKTINIVEDTNGSNTHRIFISYTTGDSNNGTTGIYYFDCDLETFFPTGNTTIEIKTITDDTTGGYTSPSFTHNYHIHSASSTSGNIYYAGINGAFSYDINTNNLILEDETTNYNNIYAFNDTHAIAVSTTGISYTVDGSNWINKTFTELGLSTMVLNSVFIQSSSNAIAVGSQGEFIYSTDWQNGVWQMVPDVLLNSSGMRDRIRGSENNLKSISMPDINTMIIADTITPFIPDTSTPRDFTLTQLGYSKIQYCFLPNLFNRTNNTVLDVSGNIVISGDVEVFDGELLVNTIDYKSQNTADISGTMNIGTKTHVVNIGKTDERTEIDNANRIFDNCESVINIGVNNPNTQPESAMINFGNWKPSGANFKRNLINIGGGTDKIVLGGKVEYTDTSISSSKNKGFQINDFNLHEGIKAYLGVNDSVSTDAGYQAALNNSSDISLGITYNTTQEEYLYTFDGTNTPLQTYLTGTYTNNVDPFGSGAGTGIFITDNLDRDAGYLKVSQDMSGWVMKPTNVGSNSIKIDVNSLILRDNNVGRSEADKNIDISYGIPEQITNGIVMLTRTPDNNNNNDCSYALTVQQLDVDNILIRDSESSVTNQIIKTDVKVEGDLEIVGQLSASSVLNTYVINTTTTDYEFIVTEDMSLNGSLLVGGDVSFNSNMDISGNVAIGKHAPVVTLDISGTDALRLPVGGTGDRPIYMNDIATGYLQIKGGADTGGGFPVLTDSVIREYLGSIRYNSETSQFEGFGPGEAWGSLGGVINVAQNTKITAESGPAEPNNQLRFYTAYDKEPRLQMIIDASSGGVAIGTGYATDVSKNDLDISDNSLIVEGKVGIGTDSPKVILDISGTNALRLPVGNTATRPIFKNSGGDLQITETGNSSLTTSDISGYMGSIRYNSQTSQFEGFGPGEAWGSLGGVINVAQNTKITAESGPAETNNQLQFFTAPKVGSLSNLHNHFKSRLNNLTDPINVGTGTHTLNITGGSGSGAKVQLSGTPTSGIDQFNISTTGSGYIKGDILTVTAADLINTGRTTDLTFTLTTDGNTNSYDVYLDPDNVDNNDGTMAERMIVDSNGYVGIGTTAPTALLDISGTMNVTGATVLDGTLTVNTTGVVDINSGAFTIDGSTVGINANAGAINIGNNNDAQSINVGTGSSARTITVGNAASTAVNTNAKAINLTSVNALTLTDGIASFAMTGTGGTSINNATTLGLNATSTISMNSTGGAINIGNNNDAQSINVGTGSSARTITVGNAASTAVNTNAKAINLTSVNALTLTDGIASFAMTGTGGTSINNATTLGLNATSTISMNSTGGAINIGNNNDAQSINVGTGSSARTITVGNGTGTTKLDINAGTGGIIADTTGSISLDAAAASNFTTSAGTITVDGKTGIDLKVNGSSKLSLASNGKVSINGSAVNGTSTVMLEVNGECKASQFNAISDARFKTNIQHVTGSLSSINQLNGVSFTWIGDDTNKQVFGLIAQEVEKVLPEIVNTSMTKNEQGFNQKSIHYDGLFPHLIESVKTLSKENETIKQENETIKQENETLKTKVNSLETKMEMIMKHLNL